MRLTALLLLAFTTAALFGVDLKPGEDLPYARLTIIQGDGRPNVLEVGWWDADIHQLFPDRNDELFAVFYPDDRIAKIDVAGPGKAPKRMPDSYRKQHADSVAAKRADGALAPKP